MNWHLFIGLLCWFVAVVMWRRSAREDRFLNTLLPAAAGFGNLLVFVSDYFFK